MVSIPRRVLRGFREAIMAAALRDGRQDEVSIPRRVLRGFRETMEAKQNFANNRFNTPEGVEGFSRIVKHELQVILNAAKVSIPRRVLRGFRGPLRPSHSDFIPQHQVSIPRRVLRDFRDGIRSVVTDIPRQPACFNTPEGVEGFSRLLYGAAILAKLNPRVFQYPGGC